MTSQESRSGVGPRGTRSGVLGGAPVPLARPADKIFHTTMAPYGIMPVPTPETKPYWDGAKEGKLMLQRCQSCGYYNLPPVYVCNKCGDRDALLAWEPVSGKGTLNSWYICHDSSVNGFEDKVPYAVLMVELDEQPNLLLMSNILNHEYGGLGEGLENGMHLEVVFDKASDDIFVPQFQPARSQGRRRADHR